MRRIVHDQSNATNRMRPIERDESNPTDRIRNMEYENSNTKNRIRKIEYIKSNTINRVRSIASLRSAVFDRYIYQIVLCASRSALETLTCLQEAKAFSEYARDLSEYLLTLEQRLFSEGLHTLGHLPTAEETEQYLTAYYADQLPPEV